MVFFLAGMWYLPILGRATSRPKLSLAGSRSTATDVDGHESAFERTGVCRPFAIRSPTTTLTTAHKWGISMSETGEFRRAPSAWHQAHVSNGPTEAANKEIKRVKRAAFGFTSFANYRVRTLLYAGKPNWDLLATITPR
jgi:hypothetical protein